MVDLPEKTVKDSVKSLAFRVKMGEYELEINGSRDDVFRAINELPSLMGNVCKAFEKLKPKRTTTLTVKTAPAAEEKRPTRKYPKIPRLEDCGKAVLKVLAKILGIEIDMAELDKKAKQTEIQIARIKKVISAQKEAEDRQKELMKQTPDYIR